VLIVKSRNGVPVRLTDERWNHIVGRHPEMASQRDRVLGAVGDPDLIQRATSASYWRFVARRIRRSATSWSS